MLIVTLPDQLATTYTVAGGAGGYQATGACMRRWMATVVTLS